MTREEVKKKIYDKKVKKALRSYRFRPFKNFIFWLTGVLTSVAVVAGAVFVGVKVVPIKTYTGGMEEGYVSEEIASKSILDVLLNYNQYGMSDIPGITNSLVETIAGSIAGNYIAINAEKLSTVKFNLDKDGGKAMIEGLLNSITLNPEGLSSINESISNLSIFNEYEETTAPEESNGTLVDTSLAKLYYCEDKDVEQDNGGNQPASAESAQTVKYVRAYDDSGKRLAKANAKLYYPALKDVPILDITQMIDKFVDRIDIGEVVGIVLLEVKNRQLFYDFIEALSENNVEVLESIVNSNEKSKFTIKSVLSEQIDLSELSSISLYNWGTKVDDAIFEGKLENGNIKVDADKSSTAGKTVYMLNPALYYYEVTDGDFDRAFDDNGERIEASEGKDLYYANLLDTPFSDLKTMLSETINSVNVGELLRDTFKDKLQKENSLTLTLMDSLSGKKVSDLDNLATDLLSKFTMDSLNVDLGAFTKLSVFSEWEQVKALDMPIKSSETQISNGTNPKLYYYVVDNTDVGEGGKLNDTAYARAFNDDGSVVEGVTSATALYYAKLSYVGFMDMAELMQDRIGALKAIEMLEAFGGASFNGGDLFSLVLGDKTISELGSIFGADIYLYWVMPYSATTKDTYELILNAMGKEFTDSTIQSVAESITIDDLTNTQLDFNNIPVGEYLDNATLTLICKAINSYRTSAEYKAQHEGQAGKEVSTSIISIGDMKDFSTDYILLKDVANGMGDNIKELICQLVNETDFDKITVKHLSNMNSFDGVTLNTVLPYEDNVALYKILLEATTSVDVSALNAVQLKTEAEALSISALSRFNISNVRLATAMPSINPTLEKMIKQITKNDDFNSIKISNLSGTI
ncbi:MAG: hypothetical protein IKB67_01365 [Clostridia bacterium]|nr:hypothetical protein [Clostridia bacterium]